MNEAPAIHLTKHALQRGKERLRLNASGLTRAARKAMLEGMPMSETKGDLWHHMEAKMLLKLGLGNMTRIHQDVVFIIHNHRLITVYPLPAEHRPQVRKWLSKNPPPAKPAGSSSDPHSAPIIPAGGLEARQTVQKALKRSKKSATPPAFGGNDEIRMPNGGRAGA